MSRSIPRHALHLPRHIQQIMNLRLIIIPALQFFGFCQCAVKRHIGNRRHQFRDAIHHCIGQSHHAPNIPNGTACRHGSKSYNLCDMVCSVFLNDIINHFRPPVICKINVKIRHAHAFWIQETFKQQVILNGINSGDADAVGGKAPRTGTPARADRNPDFFGMTHKIINNQIIVYISHLLDGAKFILQPLGDFRRWMLPIMIVKAGIALFAEIIDIVLSIGCVKTRQLGFSEFKLHMAALRNLDCIICCFRMLRKKRAHLLFSFVVKLLTAKIQPALFIQRMVGLNAKKDVMHLTVLLMNIMTVISYNQRNSGFLRQAENPGIHPFLLRQPVILQFQIKVVRAENGFIPQRSFFCSGVIIGGKGTGNFAG